MEFADDFETVEQTTEAGRRRYALAEKMATPDRFERVLDVGCWTGGHARFLEECGYPNITAVDLPGPWLTLAKSYPTQRIRYISVESLDDLPTLVGYDFDAVYFLETMEHVPRGQDASVFRTLVSLLRPGGVLILSTPVAGLANLLDPAWVLTGHRHYRARTLDRMAASAGLTERVISYSGNLRTQFGIIALYINKYVFGQPLLPANRLQLAGNNTPARQRRQNHSTIWMRGIRSPGGFPKDIPITKTKDH